jgi:hypothetical protein
MGQCSGAHRYRPQIKLGRGAIDRALGEALLGEPARRVPDAHARLGCARQRLDGRRERRRVVGWNKQPGRWRSSARPARSRMTRKTMAISRLYDRR